MYIFSFINKWLQITFFSSAFQLKKLEESLPTVHSFFLYPAKYFQSQIIYKPDASQFWFILGTYVVYWFKILVCKGQILLYNAYYTFFPTKAFRVNDFKHSNQKAAKRCWTIFKPVFKVFIWRWAKGELTTYFLAKARASLKATLVLGLRQSI